MASSLQMPPITREMSKKQLCTLDSLKCIFDKCEDCTYVIGRLTTLDILFGKNNCINRDLRLKRLSLKNDDWDEDINKVFIKYVINDLINKNKAVYVCLDISCSHNISSMFLNIKKNPSIMNCFEKNFINDNKQLSMYAIEMNEIIATKSDFVMFKDNEKTVNLNNDHIHVYTLLQKKEEKEEKEDDIFPIIKLLLNRLTTKSMISKLPTLPTPSVLTGVPPHKIPVDVLSGNDTKPNGGSAAKIMAAGRWRNQHYIKVGKRKKVAFAKYNGIYVPVCFIDWMSKK